MPSPDKFWYPPAAAMDPDEKAAASRDPFPTDATPSLGPKEQQLDPADDDDDDDGEEDDDGEDSGYDDLEGGRGALAKLLRASPGGWRPIRPPWRRWLGAGNSSPAKLVRLILSRAASSTVLGLATLTILLSLFLIFLFRPPPYPRAAPGKRGYPELYDACSSNAWRPGLYVNCTLSMGLNNLRSEFSTCLKFAFDAGAGLVLPDIVLRDNATLSAWALEGDTVQHARTSLYFDTEGLRDDLAAWCPQMRLRDQFDTTGIAVQVKDRPREWWELRFAAGTYRTHFDELLALHDVRSWTPTRGAIVEETMRPYAVWDYRSQAAAVTHAWFDLIRWAPRLQATADEVAAHPALAEGYIGVHLRLEGDAFEYWSGFEAQTNAYAYYIDQRNETTLYLACGDRSFKPKVEARFPNHTVVDKWDLAPLGTPLRDAIETLSFDEMAVVDYVPMLSANLVMGIGVSSFAYLLGVDRRVNRTGHYADTLHQEMMPPGDPMVGDANTLLLPFILPEYYHYFP